MIANKIAPQKIQVLNILGEEEEPKNNIAYLMRCLNTKNIRKFAEIINGTDSNNMKKLLSGLQDIDQFTFVIQEAKKSKLIEFINVIDPGVIATIFNQTSTKHILTIINEIESISSLQHLIQEVSLEKILHILKSIHVTEINDYICEIGNGQLSYLLKNIKSVDSLLDFFRYHSPSNTSILLKKINVYSFAHILSKIRDMNTFAYFLKFEESIEIIKGTYTDQLVSTINDSMSSDWENILSKKTTSKIIHLINKGKNPTKPTLLGYENIKGY